MMFLVGDLVRVLPPFAESFPGIHEVTLVHPADENGQIAYELNGDGAFDPKFLEAAE